MVCLRKMFNGKTIFHFKKETEKIVFLPVTDLIQIIFKVRTKKISLYVYLSFTKHRFRGMKYCAPNIMEQYSQTEQIETLGFLKENKLACFTNNEGSFLVIDLAWDV